MERKFVEKWGSYTYSEVRACTWFYTGIVNERQLYPLCGQDIPSIIIPGDFAVLFRINIPEEEIIAELEDRAFDEAVQRAYSQERNALRSKKSSVGFKDLHAFQRAVAGCKAVLQGNA
ncbi:MAG: hypothetical protein N2V78_01935, partial [Methanophagales archaeon]|nr:hypothetical protein [Methanophagales archaeon]